MGKKIQHGKHYPLSRSYNSSLSHRTNKCKAVLVIRDILVRMRRSVPLWLTDPDPAPFFSDFKDAKKIIYFFHIFFLLTYPQAHYLRSLIYCFKDKFCVKILFCKHYFSLLNTFLRKGKDPDPFLWLTDPDPGDPKTCGSCGSGSRSATLI